MTLPAPTALGATVRYIPTGTRQYVWVATIADPSAPTSSEITAGTDLTGEIAKVSGFVATANTVDVPDAKNLFTAKVPGRSTADNSSLELYVSSTSTDARSLLTAGLNGFIVIFPEGIHTSNKMDVWPVRINSASKPNDIEVGATLMVEFSVTSAPHENLAIPSA